jgi:hypothetical protein
LIDRRFKCRLCGEEGHNRRTCRKSRSSNQGDTVKRNHRCRLCHQSGHNRRTCPQVIGVKLSGTHATRGSPTGSRTCTCQLCQERGHNIRTCPRRIINPSLINPQSEEINEWPVFLNQCSFNQILKFCAVYFILYLLVIYDHINNHALFYHVLVISGIDWSRPPQEINYHK